MEVAGCWLLVAEGVMWAAKGWAARGIFLGMGHVDNVMQKGEWSR
jgi:hypothetical protein